MIPHQNNNDSDTKLTVTLLAWWLGLLLIVCSYIVPILSGPWPTFFKEIFAAFGLAALSLSAGPDRISRSTLFLGGIILVVFAQYAFGLIIFRDDAILPIGYLLMLALSIEIGRKISAPHASLQGDIQNKSKLDSFWASLLLAGIFSSIVAIRQRLGLTSSDFELPLIGSRPYANLGQPNHLNDLLFLSLCAVFFFHANKKIRGHTAWALSSLLLVAMAIAQSRTAWVMLSFSTLFLGWLAWKRTISLSATALASLIIVYVSAVFAAPLVSGINDASTSIATRAASGHRTEIWWLFIESIWSGDWYGFGWNQAVFAQISSNIPNPEYGRLDYSHSLILDLLVWTGPWLGALFLIMAGIWLLRLITASRSHANPAATLAVCGLGIHALLEYPHAYLFFLVPFGLALGTQYLPPSSKGSASVRLLWIAITCLLTLAALVANFEYKKVEQSKLSEQLKRARITNIKEIDLSDTLILEQLIEEQRQYRRPQDQSLTAEQLERLEKLTLRRPTLANLVRLAMNQWRNHNLDSTCETLDLIQKIYDTDQRNSTAAFLANISAPPPQCTPPDPGH